MSDEQLAVLLYMIQSKLERGLSKIKDELPESLIILTGEANNFFNPPRASYPILKELEDLVKELDVSFQLLTTKPSQQ